MKTENKYPVNWYVTDLRFGLERIHDLSIELDTLKPTSRHSITEDEFYRIVRLSQDLGTAKFYLERNIIGLYKQMLEDEKANDESAVGKA